MLLNSSLALHTYSLLSKLNTKQYKIPQVDFGSQLPFCIALVVIK